MKKLLYAYVLISTLLAATHAASGADEPAQKPAEVKSRAAGLPFRGKVSAVDKEAKTVSLAGKEKSRTFQITATTKIKKEGKSATLAELAVGESVGGYALRNDSGLPEVVTLNIGKPAKAREETETKP
jgi:hypothetical protein